MSDAHKGNTDKIHEVKLPSAIQQVLWTRPVAVPGGKVGLEVHTHFVGNGAPLEIILSDHDGRNHGTFKDKLHAGRFTSELAVPAKAAGALYAEAKLPKHGLSMKSPALLLMPPVEIVDARWDKEKAYRDEVLKLSATIRGAPDGTEAQVAVFEHDDQGAHDLVTSFPVIVRSGKVESEWEFQYAQDTARIPTFDETRNGYAHPRFFFRVSVGGVTADSATIAFHDWIDIALTDEDDTPVPNMDYIIKFADGSERRGKLGEDGKARVEDVPPGPYFVSFPDVEDGVPVDSSEVGANE